MVQESDCWRALFTGDLKSAVEGFEALRQDGDPVNASAGLFLASVFADAGETAQSILADRRRQHDDLGLLLWRATWICATNGIEKALDLLETFLNGIDAPDSWRAPLYYGRGHVAALDGNRDIAIRDFIAAGGAFGEEPGLFLKHEDSSLRSVVFQSMHMISFNEFAEIVDNANGLAGNNEPAAWIDAPSGSRLSPDRVVLAAADPHYARRFGVDFAASLLATHPGTHLHLNIVDGTSGDFHDIVGHLPINRRGNVSGSLSDTGRWPVHKPPVYASARFMVTPAVLSRFGKPVFVLDIDATLKKPLDPLFGIAGTHDFCCWTRPDGGPGGYTAAGASSFSPNGGATMARLAGAYIERRLAQEKNHLWFVDQAALFRAAHHLDANPAGDFSWGDFTPAGEFADFFNHAEESPDKRR